MRFGGVKRIEDSFQVIHGDANSLIDDGNQYLGMVGVSCAHDNSAFKCWYHFHGVASIHDQVDQYLLQLYWISVERRQIGSAFGAQYNTLTDQFIAQQCTNFRYQLVDVDCLRLRFPGG